MPDQFPVTLIERYGSFGLVAVVLIWVGAWVVPRVMAAFRDLTAAFQGELKQERESRERQHKECEETHRKTADILSGLATQVQRMNDRTEEYHPARPQPRRRAEQE